jgi:hypothetical protein
MDILTLVMIATFIAVMCGVLFVVFATDLFRESKQQETPGLISASTQQDPRVLGTQPAYAEEGSPFWPQHLVDLFFRPKKFFAGQLSLGKTPYFVFVTWCYGIASTMHQVYRDLGRQTASRASSSEKIPEAMFTGSWLEFWLWVLGIGAVGGFFLWLMGGWWFSVRLRWSGIKELKDKTAHLLYVYSSFVESSPTIALALFWTATEANLREAFAAGRPYLAGLLVFAFWSLGVSYIGARTLFDVNRWKARVWLLLVPAMIYIFPLGLLVASFISFRPAK